jgi:predicted nucleic-acid-binding protein
VRPLARDEAKRVRAAAEFVLSGAWISHLALAETIWVLDAVYERTAEQIATAIDLLLAHQHLAMQDADVVARSRAFANIRHWAFPIASCWKSPGSPGTCRWAPLIAISPSWLA